MFKIPGHFKFRLSYYTDVMHRAGLFDHLDRGRLSLHLYSDRMIAGQLRSLLP